MDSTTHSLHLCMQAVWSRRACILLQKNDRLQATFSRTDGSPTSALMQSSVATSLRQMRPRCRKWRTSPRISDLPSSGSFRKMQRLTRGERAGSSSKVSRSSTLIWTGRSSKLFADHGGLLCIETIESVTRPFFATPCVPPRARLVQWNVCSVQTRLVVAPLTLEHAQLPLLRGGAMPAYTRSRALPQ